MVDLFSGATDHQIVTLFTFIIYKYIRIVLPGLYSTNVPPQTGLKLPGKRTTLGPRREAGERAGAGGTTVPSRRRQAEQATWSGAGAKVVAE
jgi:hypothetical protein